MPLRSPLVSRAHREGQKNPTLRLLHRPFQGVLHHRAYPMVIHGVRGSRHLSAEAFALYGGHRPAEKQARKKRVGEGSSLWNISGCWRIDPCASLSQTNTAIKNQNINRINTRGSGIMICPPGKESRGFLE
ncbi:hypothetical protein KM043_001223 [Ampulex compressa]|nr:hypothetical protein KM043_001223 [Ampulex compressa]